MNTVIDRGMHVLHASWFGCAAGVHTFWLTVECDAEDESRAVLPPSLRNIANITEV